MLHKVTSLRDFGRKVSPPQPTFMTDEQKSDYLSSLRNQRPARPGGSRPPPFKSATYNASTQHTRLDLLQEPRHESIGDREVEPNDSHRRSSGFSSSQEAVGRPVVQAPANQTPSMRGRKISPTAVILGPVTGDASYQESAPRMREKQEAQRLRRALETMDLENDEETLHNAARDEAAELVWRHRNPGVGELERTAAYKTPDLSARTRGNWPRKGRAGIKAETRSGIGGGQQVPASKSSRSISASSSCSQDFSIIPVSEQGDRRNFKNEVLTDALQELKLAAATHARTVPVAKGSIRRKSSGQRYVSNGSSKGAFRNPEDHIYEEPETALDLPANRTTAEDHSIPPLRPRARNSLPRGSRPLPQKSNTMPLVLRECRDRFEIHRNPPSQSRNAAYTFNPSTLPPGNSETGTPPSKDGLEIRSDDIRAATSMRKIDRSPKLPTPTAVSDRPGRPIVSFEAEWNQSSDLPMPDCERPMARPMPLTPVMAVSAPVLPTVNFPDQDPPAIPTMHLPDDDTSPLVTVNASIVVPTISMPDDKPVQARPLPKHSQTSPPKLQNTKSSSRLPWLNPLSRGVPTATCANCALPISGRIVTASGSSEASSKARFHPECFSCNHCSTSLECIAFYPEPEKKRLERLEAEGMDPDSPEAELRFYCHLDFHEFFSPRCRSCKTPIEGEVILAAGSEWHVGHFFCGECGNPFDSDTPFVEKDGYAYCVSCHTKRTSARCKSCKKQILDELTVEALGGQWHEDCFVCYECGSGFGEEGKFFVRDVEVETTEKEKRRGIGKKFEERAVCEGCEGARLKA